VNLTRQDLDWAASQGLIEEARVGPLWEALRARDQGGSAFDLVHILYAFGAILVVAAMTWFMSEAWQQYGGGVLAVIAVAYCASFVLLGRRMRRDMHLPVPGGLLYTLAVVMVPVAIWGLQQATGMWAPAGEDLSTWYYLEAKHCRLVLEAATIVAGLAALWWTRFPLLLVPVLIAVWAAALDLTLVVVGGEALSDEQTQWVAVYLGLAVLFASYLADRRTEVDYAFWGYLLGLAAFWGGLSSMESDSEWSKLLYCGINVGLMALSVLFARRAFMLFGAFGVFIYLADLAERLFADSLLFPVALVALGLAIIYLGARYQRRRDQVEETVRGWLPDAVRRLLPTERRACQAP